ncbi:unnamed protein product [Calypogeia fissa]
MGPQMGTLTDLGAKSYAPFNLGASGTSADDKGGVWTRGGQRPWQVVPWPYEWPLGHTSGPDGRAWAPKCPKGVLISSVAIEPHELGGSCVLALGLGPKNLSKNKVPKVARGWQIPISIYEGGGLLKVLGANPSGNGNDHKFGPDCLFGDLLVSLESL